ncbi:hypothetical protein Vadar_017632 [Vaccinium darrowii]|uniref:Uncharacterized protein n=1 Tax=Vaccinium darrowii TaxID=229202 RepID=A0ACB7YWU7_9ERIC|nr:hypothetical protein Vadar_017632 [Vaccinium darrowii]
MGKTIRIDTYFKRRSDKISEAESSLPTCNVDTPIVPITDVDPPISELLPTKTRRVEIVEIDLSSLERDPGLRKSIYDYHITQRDEIRRAYIKAGQNGR